MANSVRPLAEIIKILTETAANLSSRATELVDALVELFPPDEEPAPLTVNATEDTTDTTRMTVLIGWDNSGSGKNVTIDWGATDAVDDEEPATGTATYKYASAGTYTVTVTDLEDGSRTATQDVTVPYTAS